MRILTLDNKSYHLNNLPEEIEDDFSLVLAIQGIILPN